MIVAINPESSSFRTLRSFRKTHLGGMALHFRKPDFLILSGEKVKGRNKKEKGGGTHHHHTGRKGYVYHKIQNACLKLIPSSTPAAACWEAELGFVLVRYAVQLSPWRPQLAAGRNKSRTYITEQHGGNSADGVEPGNTALDNTKLAVSWRYI